MKAKARKHKVHMLDGHNAIAFRRCKEFPVLTVCGRTQVMTMTYNWDKVTCEVCLDRKRGFAMYQDIAWSTA